MKKALFVLALVFSVGLYAEEAATTDTAKPEEKAAAPAAAPVDATTKTFSGESAKIKEMLETLFDASKKVNKPVETKNKYRGIIESGLDWNQVATSCLGKNVSKGSAAQKEQFKNLLKDVAVKTAYTRLDTFWDGAKYKFDDITANGTDGHAHSSFTVKGDTFGLDYYLSKKSGKWLIVDIAFKNERYSVNIKEQINEFLSQGNFAKLLDKLKKRREELDRETVTSAGAKKREG